jgi:hypothetical protein
MTKKQTNNVSLLSTSIYTVRKSMTSKGERI